MKRMFLLLTIFLASSISNAQFKRLHVGDKVPDVKFKSVRNYTGTNKRLSDFRDKYIILDFWDKTCGACISAMPEMERLQNKFKNDLQVLLVTKNNEGGLSELLKNSPIVRQTKLPMVLSENILTKVMFPADRLPHHVWLDKNYKVLAITYSYETTEKNIAKMINGEDVKVDSKDAIYACDDISSGKKTILTFGNGVLLKDIIYYSGFGINTGFDSQKSDQKESVLNYSLFTRRIETCNPQNGITEFKNSNGKTIGRLWYNSSIIPIITSVYSQFVTGYFNDGKFNGVSNKIFIDEELPFSLIADSLSDKLKSELTYCYESFMQDFSDEKFYERIKDDLFKAFGCYGVYEKRPIKCYVLRRSPMNSNLPLALGNDKVIFEDTKTEKGFIMSNSPFSQLVSYLGSAFSKSQDPQIINETGIPANTFLTMVLNIKGLRDVEGLKRELPKFGIELIEETRTLTILVLKKLDVQNITK